MAIVVEDKHGRLTRKRRADGKNGPPLDRRSAHYYSVVGNVWSRGYPTRREAERDESERKNAAEDGTSLSRSKMRLDEFLTDVWLPLQEDKVARGDLRESSLAHYRLHVETYIVPEIGSKRLRDLRAEHLRGLYRKLARRGGRSGRGLAPKTVRHTHTILSNALELAASDGYVARNVAKSRDTAPGGRSPEMKTWTPEQIRAFLEVAAEDRLAAAWRLAATTGMRRGEVLGLRWSDVDLDDRIVRVERSLVLSGKGVRYEPPKTERGRARRLDRHRHRPCAARPQEAPGRGTTRRVRRVGGR